MSMCLPIKEDIEEIDDDDVVVVAAPSWDILSPNLVQNILSYCMAIGDRSLDTVLAEFNRAIGIAAKKVISRPLLRDKVVQHLYYFHLYYAEVRHNYITMPHYYDLMEEILAKYVCLELEIVRHIERKNYMEYTDRLRAAGSRVCQVLMVLLDYKEEYCLHVLLKVNPERPNGQIKDTLGIVYNHFLRTMPLPKQVTDETFCRQYLAMQKWKDIHIQDQKPRMDAFLIKKFNTSFSYIEESETLRSILIPKYNNCNMDARIFALQGKTVAINAYFEHMKKIKANKRQSPIIFDSIMDMSINDDDSNPEVSTSKTAKNGEFSKLYDNIMTNYDETDDLTMGTTDDIFHISDDDEMDDIYPAHTSPQLVVTIEDGGDSDLEVVHIEKSSSKKKTAPKPAIPIESFIDLEVSSSTTHAPTSTTTNYLRELIPNVKESKLANRTSINVNTQCTTEKSDATTSTNDVVQASMVATPSIAIPSFATPSVLTPSVVTPSIATPSIATPSIATSTAQILGLKTESLLTQRLEGSPHHKSTVQKQLFTVEKCTVQTSTEHVQMSSPEKCSAQTSTASFSGDVRSLQINIVEKSSHKREEKNAVQTSTASSTVEKCLVQTSTAAVSSYRSEMNPNEIVSTSETIITQDCAPQNSPSQSETDTLVDRNKEMLQHDSVHVESQEVVVSSTYGDMEITADNAVEYTIDVPHTVESDVMTVEENVEVQYDRIENGITEEYVINGEVNEMGEELVEYCIDNNYIESKDSGYDLSEYLIPKGKRRVNEEGEENIIAQAPENSNGLAGDITFQVIPVDEEGQYALVTPEGERDPKFITVNNEQFAVVSGAEYETSDSKKIFTVPIGTENSSDDVDVTYNLHVETNSLPSNMDSNLLMEVPLNNKAKKVQASVNMKNVFRELNSPAKQSKVTGQPNTDNQKRNSKSDRVVFKTRMLNCADKPNYDEIASPLSDAQMDEIFNSNSNDSFGIFDTAKKKIIGDSPNSIDSRNNKRPHSNQSPKLANIDNNSVYLDTLTNKKKELILLPQRVYTVNEERNSFRSPPINSNSVLQDTSKKVGFSVGEPASLAGHGNLKATKVLSNSPKLVGVRDDYINVAQLASVLQQNNIFEPRNMSPNISPKPTVRVKKVKFNPNVERHEFLVSDAPSPAKKKCLIEPEKTMKVDELDDEAKHLLDYKVVVNLPKQTPEDMFRNYKNELKERTRIFVHNSRQSCILAKISVKKDHSSPTFSNSQLSPVNNIQDTGTADNISSIPNTEPSCSNETNNSDYIIECIHPSQGINFCDNFGNYSHIFTCGDDSNDSNIIVSFANTSSPSSNVDNVETIYTVQELPAEVVEVTTCNALNLSIPSTQSQIEETSGSEFSNSPKFFAETDKIEKVIFCEDKAPEAPSELVMSNLLSNASNFYDAGECHNDNKEETQVHVEPKTENIEEMEVDSQNLVQPIFTNNKYMPLKKRMTAISKTEKDENEFPEVRKKMERDENEIPSPLKKLENEEIDVTTYVNKLPKDDGQRPQLMMSIADICTGRFKTPAEKKVLPPLPQTNYFTAVDGNLLMPEQLNSNHIFNNTTINYHFPIILGNEHLTAQQAQQQVSYANQLPEGQTEIQNIYCSSDLQLYQNEVMIQEAPQEVFIQQPEYMYFPIPAETAHSTPVTQPFTNVPVSHSLQTNFLPSNGGVLTANQNVDMRSRPQTHIPAPFMQQNQALNPSTIGNVRKAPENKGRKPRSQNGRKSNSRSYKNKY